MKNLILITFALFAFLATAQTNTEQEQKIDAFIEAKVEAMDALILEILGITAEMYDEMSAEELDALYEALGEEKLNWLEEKFEALEQEISDFLEGLLFDALSPVIDSFSDISETFTPENPATPAKTEDGRIILRERHILGAYYFQPSVIYYRFDGNPLPEPLRKGCFSFISNAEELHFCINEYGQIDGEATHIEFPGPVTTKHTFNNGQILTEKHFCDRGIRRTSFFYQDTIAVVRWFDFWGDGRMERERIFSRYADHGTFWFHDTGEIWRVYIGYVTKHFCKEGRLVGKEFHNDPEYKWVMEHYDEDGNITRRQTNIRRREADDD